MSLISLQKKILSKFINSGAIIPVLQFFLFCLPDFRHVYKKERGGTGINLGDFRTSIEQSRKSLYRKEGVSGWRGSSFERGCLLQIYRLDLTDGVYFFFGVTAFAATAAELSFVGCFSQCTVSWREDFILDLKSNLCVTCATPRNQGEQTVGELYCYCFSQLRRGRWIPLLESGAVVGVFAGFRDKTCRYLHPWRAIGSFSLAGNETAGVNVGNDSKCSTLLLYVLTPIQNCRSDTTQTYLCL